MRTFNEKQTYDFDYVGLEEQDGGDVFIQLKYNNERTLPGFGFLEYRVKAFPFQTTLPEDKFPRKIRCYVKNLQPSRFNPDQEELFPFLQQDREWLLQQVYVPGFTYKFSVIGEASAGKYTLRDLDNGIDHYLYESTEPLKIGDSLELVVVSINHHYLQLAKNRYEAITKAGFKVGRKLKFTIRKQKVDENNLSYLQLVDQSRGYWHRFYLEENEAVPEHDDIELEIGEITPQGWLCLQHPGTRLTDIQTIRQSQETDFGREDNQREFKTTIVFPPDGTNQPDFSTQLRHNIMKVIAGFLNNSGGQLFIGVDNSGVVSGIEGDLPWLNKDDKDKFNGQYANNSDGYEQKITNAVSSELGELAATLISTRFFKTDSAADNGHEKVFCRIDVKPASSPVYLHGTLLFVRAGNSCRQLRNGDITSYVMDRMLNQHALQQKPAPAPAAPLKLAEESTATEVTSPVTFSPPQTKTVANWGVLSFFADGTRQFGKAVEDPDKIAAVQLTQKHRQSKFRLLQCYASGNVNAIDDLPKKVAATKNKRYKNSWNVSDQLAEVFACHENDYLVIRSIDNDAAPRIKAIQVKEIGAHDNLTAQGNALVSTDEAKVLSYQLVPERFSSFLYDIILKGRYIGPGLNESLIRCQDCIAFLEQQKKHNA